MEELKAPKPSHAAFKTAFVIILFLIIVVAIVMFVFGITGDSILGPGGGR